MSAAVNAFKLESALRNAIQNQGMWVAYQPIVDLATGRLCGFESLARWDDEVMGSVSPSKFIPVAEESGLIVPMGQFVTRQACEQLREWSEAFGSALPLTMNINVSSRQFRRRELAADIEEVLDATGVSASAIKLELTESAIMEDAQSAAEQLERLRRLGVQVAMDDFGTGYSSLSYLHQFPIDTLKIDRSFVMRLDDETNSDGRFGQYEAIVRAIVTLSHSLGIDVVAEGVETEAQLALLRGLGCEYAQGYLLARPMPAPEAARLLAEGRSWPPPARIEQITPDPRSPKASIKGMAAIRGLARPS